MKKDLDEASAISLYDDSFPVYSEKEKVAFTNAIKALNRKTQETVSFDLYDYPHVIDLKSRVSFNGGVYFLQSNTVTRDTNIVNKQSLQLIRWY